MSAGKSELLNYHFSQIRCQRLLYDSKDEWVVDGVEPVRFAEQVDWSQPIIHYASELDDREETDRLFEACYRRRRPLVVCVHELADLCDYSPNRTPPYVSAYISKGRAHGLGLLGASQRPVEMPKRARTEAQHVFVIVPRPSDEADLAAIAGMVGRPAPALAEELDQLQGELGEHAFLWFDRRAQDLAECPPLTEELRSQIIVRRRSLA